MKKEAILSRSKVYRYWLGRTWNEDKPKVCFVGLNPSTADAETDDPTVGRLIEFAKSSGYGGFDLVNLFAYRATNPKELMVCNDPVGEANKDILLHYAAKADKVVYCWGTYGGMFGRDDEVLKLLPDVKAECFGLTKHGHPKHPLYLHHTTKLEPFKREL